MSFSPHVSCHFLYLLEDYQSAYFQLRFLFPFPSLSHFIPLQFAAMLIILSSAIQSSIHLSIHPSPHTYKKWSTIYSYKALTLNPLTHLLSSLTHSHSQPIHSLNPLNLTNHIPYPTLPGYTQAYPLAFAFAFQSHPSAFLLLSWKTKVVFDFELIRYAMLCYAMTLPHLIPSHSSIQSINPLTYTPITIATKAVRKAVLFQKVCKHEEVDG